jgi:hypothetical protein
MPDADRERNAARGLRAQADFFYFASGCFAILRLVPDGGL